MARGDIVAAVTGGDFGNKPRPVVIIQADAFSGESSVTVCPFTSFFVDASFVRPEIRPDPENGLREASWAMADKIITMRADKIGARIGRLSDVDMTRLDEAIVLFLGLPQ